MLSIFNEVSIYFLDGLSRVWRDRWAHNKDFGEVGRNFDERSSLEIKEGVIETVGGGISSCSESINPCTRSVFSPK